MWYAANLMMARRFVEGPQGAIPIWEEIYLIDAPSVDDAYAEADDIGSMTASAYSDGSTYDGRPVRWTYEGVRRLSECIDFEGGPPQSGKEVTYLDYYVQSDADIKKMLSKQSATILLDGDDITAHPSATD